jgi:uncharacterized SAM-binding protein YcdF (DUF218 family)
VSQPNADAFFHRIQAPLGCRSPKEFLLVLLFALGLLLARFGSVRLGQSFAFGAIFTTCVIAIFLVVDGVLRPLEKAYPIEPGLRKVAGIVVVGGGESGVQSNVWSQPNIGDAGDRFITALSLAHKQPDALVLFTGGSGRLMGGASGAVIARGIFLGAGLDKSRLILGSGPIKLLAPAATD